jgi:hypothetical protein
VKYRVGPGARANPGSYRKPLTKGVSIDAKTPFDKFRVCGKSPFKSNLQPLRLSLSKPLFGENRRSYRAGCSLTGSMLARDGTMYALASFHLPAGKPSEEVVDETA